MRAVELYISSLLIRESDEFSSAFVYLRLVSRAGKYAALPIFTYRFMAARYLREFIAI